MKKIIFFLLVFGVVLPFGFNRPAFASTATGLQAGTITVQSEDTSGNPVSATWVISGPVTLAGSGITKTYTNESVGSYTITLPTPPAGYALETVSPAQSQSLLGGGAITFTVVWQGPTSALSAVVNPESELLPLNAELGRLVGAGIANAPSGANLSATQGYDSQTNAYESVPNVFEAGDTYLILYGAFAASGNTVMVNGSALPTNQVAYQSTNQINISLDSSFVGTSFTVAVAGTNGTTATVAVNGSSSAASSSINGAPTEAFFNELENASDIDTAVNIAESAGFTVTGGVVDSYGASTADLVTRSDGTFVAALGQFYLVDGGNTSSSSVSGIDARNFLADVGQLFGNTAVGAPSSGTPGAAGQPSRACVVSVGSSTSRVIVWPDGKIYGFGNAQAYGLYANCDKVASSSCALLGPAAQGAATAVAVAGGSPAVWQTSPGPYNDNIVINLLPSISGGGLLRIIAGSVPIIAADGSNRCTIIVSENAITGPLKANPDYLEQVLEHEIAHCMGLGHSLNNKDLMYWHQLVMGTRSFSSDDKAVLQLLKSGADIPVKSCVNNSNTRTTGGPIESTSTPTSTSNICYDLSDGSVSCNCAEGYSQSGDACVPFPTCSSNPDAAGCPTFCESNPSDPSCNACAQNPNLAQCHTCPASNESWSKISNQCLANGSSTDNICFDDNSCLCGTGFVQSGATCVPENTNSYSCSENGACASDPNGGYSDSNCDDQCTASTGGASNGDYSCMPNWDSGGFECVQVPVGSGSYSDSSCGGEC